LDEDSLRRLETNPLRILDSKNPAMQGLLQAAPILLNHFGAESLAHFAALKSSLDALKISYQINTRLVRGLDYYGKTVFEWVTSELGAQGTICAGGRYDGLIEQLGGKANHAIGFAMGMERILSLLEQIENQAIPNCIDVYMIRVGSVAEAAGLQFAEQIRDQIPGLKLQVNCDGGSFKSQFKKADKSGAAFAIILGDEEANQQQAALKSLRVEQEQTTLTYPELLQTLQNWHAKQSH
jgi:histidyl-tRNA synthetase